MAAVVTVDGLRKTYGSTVAVDDMSFAVEEGEIFGILGPNGAGKTTTVECIQGLRTIDAGSVRVLGYDPVTDVRALRDELGKNREAEEVFLDTASTVRGVREGARAISGSALGAGGTGSERRGPDAEAPARLRQRYEGSSEENAGAVEEP